MATQVPKKSRVLHIVRFLKESGGTAKAKAVQQSVDPPIRCLATFISDARKLGAVIEYNKDRDELQLQSGITRDKPLQRNIKTIVDAMLHAEEWLSRRKRGAIDSTAVRLLAQHARETTTFDGYVPDPTPRAPPPSKTPTVFNKRLW